MRVLFLCIVFISFVVSAGETVMAGEQTQRSSPGCTGGDKEAEALFQQALNYEHGMRDMPRDISKAMKLYEESMDMGNPKAAINLGTIYRYAFVLEPKEQERLDYMNALYKYAIKLGCPDGYYFLALSYYNGWGVKIDQKQGDLYTKQGAEAGSLAAMYGYGIALKEDHNTEEAKVWLHKALAGGFGIAGYELSIIYQHRDRDYQKMIDVLRQGAKLGDTMCLYSLGDIYVRGDDGQPKDEAYGVKFLELFRQIDEKEPPKIIEDFDKRFPPRKVIPYNEKQ